MAFLTSQPAIVATTYYCTVMLGWGCSSFCSAGFQYNTEILSEPLPFLISCTQSFLYQKVQFSSVLSRAPRQSETFVACMLFTQRVKLVKDWIQQWWRPQSKADVDYTLNVLSDHMLTTLLRMGTSSLVCCPPSFTPGLVRLQSLNSIGWLLDHLALFCYLTWGVVLCQC